MESRTRSVSTSAKALSSLPAARFIIPGIQTQGGVSVYSLVKFNLKPVSDSVNQIIVNNATMQLTLKNPLSAIGFESVDSVVAYLAGSPTQFNTIRPPISPTATARIQHRQRTACSFLISPRWCNIGLTPRATILAPSCVQSAAPPTSTSTSSILPRTRRMLHGSLSHTQRNRSYENGKNPYSACIGAGDELPPLCRGWFLLFQFRYRGYHNLRRQCSAAMGGTGVASLSDGYINELNPAGLGQLTRTQYSGRFPISRIRS